MKNGMTREFDVRLRDEECDRANGVSDALLNKIAEAEAEYNPTSEWEKAMQALADLIGYGKHPAL